MCVEVSAKHIMALSGELDPFIFDYGRDWDLGCPVLTQMQGHYASFIESQL
jgi:hypothetical protein